MSHTFRTRDGRGPATASTLGRRSFIGGAAAAAVVAVACSGDDDSERTDRDDTDGTAGTEPDVTRTTLLPAGHLQWKGVNLDTDRELWNPAFARREIEVIARDLHCNSLLLLGSDLDRLTEGAALAADQGLHVWLEPRQFDASANATIEFVSSVARAAEELRTDHGKVSLSLGVELTIFLDGLVPGGSWDERGAALGTTDPATYNAALNRFLADALTSIRPIFGGPLTYSSGVWEDVDWTDFDIVGIDLYRDVENEATFVADVRALHRHGKPVVITEFGCCSFRGAEDMGGGGFTVIDWTVNPPTVREGLVRDEQVQARYIDDLLGIFTAEKVDGAFIYDFIEPGNPHRPDPRHDLDMAGFGVVTCYPSDHELAYDRTGHFEPKPAFHTIARHFA
jgi:hypothetical protein